MARDTHKCWIGLDEKIVHGLKYDTEKASPIASDNNLHKAVDYTTDFGYWEATLYITENNRFFLAGEGGPTSLFRQAVGVNSWAGSKGIIPLESQDAFEWAQKHLGEEIVEAHFVDWIEDA